MSTQSEGPVTRRSARLAVRSFSKEPTELLASPKKTPRGKKKNIVESDIESIDDASQKEVNEVVSFDDIVEENTPRRTRRSSARLAGESTVSKPVTPRKTSKIVIEEMTEENEDSVKKVAENSCEPMSEESNDIILLSDSPNADITRRSARLAVRSSSKEPTELLASPKKTLRGKKKNVVESDIESVDDAAPKEVNDVVSFDDIVEKNTSRRTRRSIARLAGESTVSKPVTPRKTSKVIIEKTNEENEDSVKKAAENPCQPMSKESNDIFLFSDSPNAEITRRSARLAVRSSSKEPTELFATPRVTRSSARLVGKPSATEVKSGTSRKSSKIVIEKTNEENEDDVKKIAEHPCEPMSEESNDIILLSDSPSAHILLFDDDGNQEQDLVNFVIDVSPIDLKKIQTTEVVVKAVEDYEKEESPAFINETNIQDEIQRHSVVSVKSDDDVIVLDDVIVADNPKSEGVLPADSAHEEKEAGCHLPRSSARLVGKPSATKVKPGSPKKLKPVTPQKTSKIVIEETESNVGNEDNVDKVAKSSCELISEESKSPAFIDETNIQDEIQRHSVVSVKSDDDVIVLDDVIVADNPKFEGVLPADSAHEEREAGCHLTRSSAHLIGKPSATKVEPGSPKKLKPVTPQKTSKIVIEETESNVGNEDNVDKVAKSPCEPISEDEIQRHSVVSVKSDDVMVLDGTKSIWIQDLVNDSQFDLEPMEIDTSLNTSNRRRLSSIVGEQLSECDADDEKTSKEQEESSSDAAFPQKRTNGVDKQKHASIEETEPETESECEIQISITSDKNRKRKSLENKTVELIKIPDAKTLLKQRGTNGQMMLKCIAQLYSDTNDLKLFKSDLPDDLIIKDDIELIWQQLSCQNTAYLKEAKKLNKLLDQDLDFKQDTKKPTVEQSLFSDDSELEDSLIEDEEEEEDFDLFGLRDEDLQDLDAQLKRLDESDDEELPKKKKKIIKSQREKKKSAADDKFFSLEEMERHQDIDNVALTDDSEDETDGEADFRYTDFFGDDVSKKTKIVPKKKVQFTDESDSEDEDDEEESDFGDGPVLLGEKSKKKVLSTHEKTKDKLQAAIERIQQENLNPRSWELSGEVTGDSRGKEALLEKYIEVDFRQRQPPINGQEKSKKIDSICLRRLKNKLFDDVERKYREDDTVQPYRNMTIDMNERKTLMEVYEDRFKAAQNRNMEADNSDPMVKDIEKQMSKLFEKLDALTHLQYAPGRVTEEIQIVKNMPSMRVEEVGPMAATAADETILAPEEITRHVKATPIAKDERNKTDKKRERRKKKHKQAEFAKVGKMPKMGKERELEEAVEKAKKSSKKTKNIDFFNQLQQKTVQDKQKQSGVAPKRKLQKSDTAAKYKG